MFPTSAAISAGMHNISSPPASPRQSFSTRRSVKDLLGLSRVQAPSRPLTPPRPGPVIPKEPASQHEVSPVEETPDSQRTVIQRRPPVRSVPVSPTAHRGSVQRLQLARAVQVNTGGDNFSYMSSLSSRDPSPNRAGDTPTRRVASSVYSRTASGYFLPLDNELTLAADAATARSFLQQQQTAPPPALASPGNSTVSSQREGGLSPFPNVDALERPLPYGSRGWASTGPHAAPSVAARRTHEEATAAAATARKRTFTKKVLDKILGRK